MTPEPVTAFNQLALNHNLIRALDEVGYETPSPIQAQTIPLLLEGRDIIGQAQTGTGKTAAFALPLISGLDISRKMPQLLVLAPTRELAIQVSEAFQKYARYLPGFHVMPIYGGSDYSSQIRALKRGVHVVVGTPGRVMDHIRKGTLKLDALSALVLDEADEMLRMGFIEDVEWILEQTPPHRQIALFSATMPQQIRRIATKYLKQPAQVTIKTKTTTVDTIRQRFWPVSGMHKLDALTRILEAEDFDAMIIFVRTRNSTVELAEKLEARGYAAAALNGDIAQNQRERTIRNLKDGKLDILVATDVAARGLDVDRISHVVNYDVPYDTEAYVHRIGRTGRAGRSGDAILFVAPREKRMLNAIEKATRKKIEIMELPSTEFINNRRINNFKQSISDILATEDLSLFSRIIEQYQQEHNVPALDIAAALAKQLQGDADFLLSAGPAARSRHKDKHEGEDGGNAGYRREKAAARARHGGAEADVDKAKPVTDTAPEEGMERFRIEVGHMHQVKPGNIVGAIANEAEIDSKYIGRINIYDDYSTVDLPEGMPREVFYALKKVWVAGQQLAIKREQGQRPAARSKAARPKTAGPKNPTAGRRAKAKAKAKPKARAKPKPGAK